MAQHTWESCQKLSYISHGGQWGRSCGCARTNLGRTPQGLSQLPSLTLGAGRAVVAVVLVSASGTPRPCPAVGASDGYPSAGTEYLGRNGQERWLVFGRSAQWGKCLLSVPSRGGEGGFLVKEKSWRRKCLFKKKVCVWGGISDEYPFIPEVAGSPFRLMPSKRHRHFGTALLTIPQALSRRDCFIRKVYGFLFSLKGKCDFVVFNSIGISPF